MTPRNLPQEPAVTQVSIDLRSALLFEQRRAHEPRPGSHPEERYVRKRSATRFAQLCAVADDSSPVRRRPTESMVPVERREIRWRHSSAPPGMRGPPPASDSCSLIPRLRASGSRQAIRSARMVDLRQGNVILSTRYSRAGLHARARLNSNASVLFGSAPRHRIASAPIEQSARKPARFTPLQRRARVSPGRLVRPYPATK